MHGAKRTQENRMEQRALRLAVLISGTGRSLENLISVIQRGELLAEIQIVVSSRDGIRGNEIARQAGIPLAVIPRRSYDTSEAFSRAVYEALDPHDVDLILTPGFLCKIIIHERYAGRIMNIHPSLLPLFGGKGMYGLRVHQAVLESGMKVTGCTVHFIDEEYDAGPVILQTCVPVHDDDTPETLGARVFAEECRLYPEAVRLYSEGRLEIAGRRVLIHPPSALDSHNRDA